MVIQYVWDIAAADAMLPAISTLPSVILYYDGTPVALLLKYINFNPAWISNDIHYKVWDKITYPFLNFNGATVAV